MESVEEDAAILWADHQMESPLEIINQTPKQKSAVGDEPHVEDPRLQDNGAFDLEPKLGKNPEHVSLAEPKEDFESCSEANLDINAVDAEVLGLKERSQQNGI